MSGLIQLLNEYGYITLFFALMLELICIPIPNEALLSYVGILSFHGQMNLILSMLSAGFGGILGATISYWIGYKLGVPFFRKYGRYIHMGPEKMERISRWYGKYGKVLLVFSFFIPGIRHIASIISGVIHLRFRSFCFFSYIGVFFWTSTFIWLGYVLGPQWDKYQGEIKKWLVLASLLIALVALCFIVIKKNRQYIKESLLLLFQEVFHRYKSFLKIKFFIFVILAAFISLVTLMIGMIQDFISNEFTTFDKVSSDIVFFLFDSRWQPLMNHFYELSSWIALGVIFVLTTVTILINNKNKWLELLFFGMTLTGGFIFSNGVRWLFHFMLSGHSISPDFPNEPAMMLLIFYGFFLMMLIRHQDNYLISLVEFCFLIFVLLAFSISGIRFMNIHPSDLFAGFVFASVWVSGLILSLELFRFLSLIKEGSRN
ncbi:VTT domain-containing protein [Sporolactobacillus kofuensis]|uniref:VTT domain-containing protein n=1 Tax=Sporolactobacillus kofuensis TaxID=269672 RepID=A0ABW1WGS4_9BACL|nr:VTT domain-containing protein [Sporolactobacillus kofuensis]MCO7175353.1 VTT domain-containing protein [Sporolactobacillus kofuensis]